MSGPVDHPPPWEWTEFGDLEDAAGAFVLFVAEEGQGKADPSFSVQVDSPVARELIRAAPEMEALLRDWLQTCGPAARTCCSVSIDSPGDHDEGCEAGRTYAILDRLDKARKVGG